MTGDIDDIDSWKVRPVVEVKPFAGLRYAVDRVGSLGLVTCPPYDVISDEQRRSHTAVANTTSFGWCSERLMTATMSLTTAILAPLLS